MDKFLCSQFYYNPLTTHPVSSVMNDGLKHYDFHDLPKTVSVLLVGCQRTPCVQQEEPPKNPSISIIQSSFDWIHRDSNDKK